MGIRWWSPTLLLIQRRSRAILWIILKLAPSSLVGESHRHYPYFVIATTSPQLPKVGPFWTTCWTFIFSDYDHVGVVIAENKRLLLVESYGGERPQVSG